MEILENFNQFDIIIPAYMTYEHPKMVELVPRNRLSVSLYTIQHKETQLKAYIHCRMYHGCLPTIENTAGVYTLPSWVNHAGVCP